MMEKFTAGSFDWNGMMERAKRQAALLPSDPEHDHGFAFDDKAKTLDLYWGRHEYSIPFSEIDRPDRLLWKLHHVLKKAWDGSTSKRVSRLIEACSTKFQWHMYHDAPHPLQAPAARHTSAAEERAKLTPALRYKILVRDGYRCRACGFGVESGAHLHIDHIQPISKNGVTEEGNLQALCSTCNLGKRDR